MSCRAEIATSRGENILQLPIEAIQSDEDEKFVWVVNSDNTVSKKIVELGISSDIEQAISSGVSEQDVVVLGPARPVSKLKEGDEITRKTASDDKDENKDAA